MTTILADSIEIIKNLVGHDILYFDRAVDIQATPHTYPMQAWAVCVSPHDELYVMDNEEQWDKLELSDRNGALVIGSLYQRLQLMRIAYAKAS